MNNDSDAVKAEARANLKVYNSLGRELQPFEPLREGFVGIYVCGPTVYGHSHVGHAKSYVSFDVIVRYLRYLGYQVRYVQNITDVGHLTDDADEGEDKVGMKARQMGIEPMEVAEMYTRSYFEDMDALNVLRPDISPRASGHITEQIEMARLLLEQGHAYEAEGNVYFDVGSFEGYGKLSGRSLDDMMAGARVEVRGDKRHPADFALWKRAEEGHIMRWPSPWSVGYPGWNLECVVMSTKYLGQPFDIHGGGIENIFPHHEDEVAQAEAAHGEQFCRYWLHNNMVTVDGQKMGKSLGNFITLKDAFAGEPPLEKAVRPLVMRYFILSSHYRSPLDFSAQALEAAEKGLRRIETAVGRVRRGLESDADEAGQPSEQVASLVKDTREEFLSEMSNDFNTAGALGVLSTFTREVNALLDAGPAPAGAADLAALDGLYRELGGEVLGIVTPETRERKVVRGSFSLSGTSQLTARATVTKEPALVDLLLDVREELREKQEFDLADSIRQRLEELGIEVQDSPDGPAWQFK